MSLHLCVDCGGSKTSAVICDNSGSILGRALGGPSNFSYLPIHEFTDAVRVAVSNALITCVAPPADHPVSLPPSTQLFATAWFGISGVDSPQAVISASAALSALLNIPLGPRLVVANDTHLLAAPLRLHPDIKHAITAIAGTGSCVVSFHLPSPSTPLSELARTGGNGWILGDEGGGFHVGRETIRQIILEHSIAILAGTPPSPSSVKEEILAQFGVKGVENAPDVLRVVHLPELPASEADIPYLQFAREKRLSHLAPIVFNAAFSQSDPFALKVLRFCARALAEQIALLCKSKDEAEAERPRAVSAKDAVLCFGGSLVGEEKYRDMVIDALKDMGHEFKYVEFVEDAAATGAEGLSSMVREQANAQGAV